MNDKELDLLEDLWPKGKGENKLESGRVDESLNLTHTLDFLSSTSYSKS